MKKNFFFILLLFLLILRANNNSNGYKYEEYACEEGYSMGKIGYAIERGDKICEKPLLKKFFELYFKLPFSEYEREILDFNYHTNISKKEVFNNVQQMIKEMDFYFEKNKKKMSTSEKENIARIGDELFSFYKQSSPKGKKSNTLDSKYQDYYFRIVNKWNIEGKAGYWKIDKDEAEKLLKAKDYLDNGRQVKKADKIMSQIFNKKKFRTLSIYFNWRRRIGQGDVALTNFYQNYKIPKQLYTNGYLPKYLDKLEGFYKNEVIIKKNKMSRWKRLITTLPEEEILENIEEERKKYKKWQKGNK